MAEKQHRKLSFIPILKILRTTFKKHISRKFGRTPSLSSSSTMQSKSASTASDDAISISTSSSKSRRSINNFSAPHRQVAPQCNSDETCPKVGGNDENPETLQDWKILRIRRFVPHLNTIESLPRRQTTVGLGHHSVSSYSRIHTPTEPPKGNLYSHQVYQMEGRRSIISPVKRRATIAHQEEGGMKLNDEHGTRPSATLAYPAAQRQMVMSRKPAAQYKDGSRQMFVRQMIPAPIQGWMLMRKVQVARDSTSKPQYLVPRYYPNYGQFFPSETTTTTESSKMAAPKRIKLTKSFEDLKKVHETPRTKLPIFKQSSKASPSTPTAQKQTTQTQAQEYEQAKEKDAQTTYPADPQLQYPRYRDADVVSSKTTSIPPSKLPLASTSSARRKIRGERMVSAPLQPMRRPNNPYPNGIPRCFSDSRNSMLIETSDSHPQVETAMPSQHWLGRFVTLTNAFHYEDSFGEPDIATGFEMPSSYSRPFQGSDDGDLGAYRVKRAFMALENLCATEEASDSLREFREGYIRRFGDRWMA